MFRSVGIVPQMFDKACVKKCITHMLLMNEDYDLDLSDSNDFNTNSLLHHFKYAILIAERVLF